MDRLYQAVCDDGTMAAALDVMILFRTVLCVTGDGLERYRTQLGFTGLQKSLVNVVLMERLVQCDS